MKTSNITLVIPVYNRERLVGRTLESIARQTFRPLQVLLVDNGSSDGSANVCEAFRRRHGADDFHISLLTEDKPGAARARNRGLDACRTPYVYFFDSDDELSPDFMERMEEVVGQDVPDLVAFPTNEVRGTQVRRRPFAPRAKTRTHILNSMLTTQSMLFRTEWLRKAGGWNERLSIWMDWELGVRALLSAPVVRWYGRKAFHRIHIHPDSITGSTYASHYEALMETMRHARKEIEEAKCGEAERGKNRTALYYRQLILSAKLLGEHAPEAAADCLRQARRDFPVGLRARLCGRLLHAYTRLGGRGAWRLALLLL